jgi:hypothetical protein
MNVNGEKTNKKNCPLFNIDVVSTHQSFILLLMSKKNVVRDKM